MTSALFLYGDDTGNDPTPYHDQRCACRRHCGNCRRDLDQHGGVNAGPRERYCGQHCKGQAARARSFDRFMESQSGSSA